MSEHHTITIGEVMLPADLKSLQAFLNAAKTGSVHLNIMEWLAAHPDVAKRAESKGLIPSYFAYCLEYAIIKTSKP